MMPWHSMSIHQSIKGLLYSHETYWSFIFSLPLPGQSDPLYVAVLRSPVATTTSPTVIEVYRGDGSGTASVVFDKAVRILGRFSDFRSEVHV